MTHPKNSRVAVIGLGIMGLPMAVNLLKAGFEVVGYNHTRAKAERLAEAGGQAAGSVSEAVRGSDVVITVLPDSPDVAATATGPDGIFANAQPDLIFVDMSTISPATAIELAEAGRTAGARVLDAPVSGGEKGAIDGTLSIMVGGHPDDVEAAAPYLSAMGTVVHVGAAGSGQTVKAANQLLTAGIIELVAEAVVFLEAYGVDAETAFKALGGGLAGSAVLERRAPDMLTRQFRPGFKASLHHKDLGIMMAAARDAGVIVPLGAVVTQLMASLVAQGNGNLDNTALLKLIEKLSGRAG